jgi:hypothetical protein
MVLKFNKKISWLDVETLHETSPLNDFDKKNLQISKSANHHIIKLTNTKLVL